MANAHISRFWPRETGVDLDAVRTNLTAHAVIAHYGLTVRRCGGDEVESAWCPRRLDHSRRAFSLNVSTGLWQCFACDYGGNLIQLVMELEGKGFAEALPIAAQIAGVLPGMAMQPVSRKRETPVEADVDARRRAAITKATERWDRLAKYDARGETYLKGRGLQAACFPSLVRFRANGDPAIVLRTADDQIVNVVTRHIDGEPKVRGQKDCPTAGTFCHALTDLEPGRDVVLVEGWADSLTAIFAFPSARVLGAHGANQLERIARAAAPRVGELGGRVLIVPHNDTAGARAADLAITACVAVGLEFGRRVHVVDLGSHKDLNVAWQKGWRHDG